MEDQITQNTELIQISETEINGTLTKTVNARDLHAFLEVGRDFSNWIKGRISTLGSIEGEDYAVVSGKNLLAKIGEEKEDERGGSNKIDYLITIDLAKHISMMEKNERGYQIRNYFIECEKRLKQVISPKQTLLLGILDANDELSRAVAINNYEIQYVKPLEKKVEEQAPKADYFDKLVDRNLLTNFRDTAKEFKVGQKFFINFLLDNKYIFRDKKNKLKPYQNHIDSGLFELKEFVRGEHTDVQTLITPKGRETFKLLLEVYQQ